MVLCHEDYDAWEEDAAQNECKRMHDCNIMWMIELQAIEESLEARIQILLDLVFQFNSLDSLILDLNIQHFHLYGNRRFKMLKVGP